MSLLTVYAICYRPEVAGDVISGETVKTIDGYAVLNFEVASFSGFPDIKKIVTSAAADIDDSIKQNRIRVSLNHIFRQSPNANGAQYVRSASGLITIV